MISNYVDVLGMRLQDGDLVFYTERPRSNYADSLARVEMDPDTGEFGTVTLIGNNGTSYVKYDGRPYWTNLKFHHQYDGKLFDTLYVEPNGTTLDELLKWVEENFPLDAETIEPWSRDE